MPIYEYEPIRKQGGCEKCRHGFETYQGIHEAPLSACPQCGKPIQKVISWCRAAVLETNPEDASVTSRVQAYEQAGMWSHAAELADKHAEKTKDKALRTRALDNYKKAGYDADSLSKHDTLNK